MHIGQEFRERNELEDIILEFALPFDLIIANTYLKMRS